MIAKHKNLKESWVSLIIPSFNGKELLFSNLPKVIKVKNNPGNKIKEIIVVDDGSTDGSGNFVKTEFPEIKTIIHKKNRGFSAAVNTGVRTASQPIVVLLNNDVFPDPSFLEKVLPLFFKNPDLFAVSFHEKGYGWAGARFENGYVNHFPGEESKNTHETFYVNAGGAAYRRDIWLKLGGMDEKLYTPFYWEDVDISYVALKRGYTLYWQPKAYVSPNLSATVSKLPKRKVLRIQERNQLLFIWKNITSPNLFRKHLAGLLARLGKHPGYLVIVIMALSKLKAVIKGRKKEKKESKVSDEAIFAKFKNG